MAAVGGAKRAYRLGGRSEIHSPYTRSIQVVNTICDVWENRGTETGLPVRGFQRAPSVRPRLPAGPDGRLCVVVGAGFPAARLGIEAFHAPVRVARLLE